MSANVVPVGNQRSIRTSAPGGTNTKQRWFWILGVTVVYAALTIGVVHGSPLDTLDQNVLHWNLHERWSALQPWVTAYEIIGQRGPSTLVALPWFGWWCWRNRTAQPLVRLALAFAMLNLSVGVVKLMVGRLGPQVTTHATAVFAGGDIFPSGHTSNAVVLFGVVAWTLTQRRKTAIAIATILSVTVGLGTIVLDTHWVSDVLGGWLAGALVLLVLPTFMPLAERITAKIIGFIPALRRRLLEGVTPVPAQAATLQVASVVEPDLAPAMAASSVSALTTDDIQVTRRHSHPMVWHSVRRVGSTERIVAVDRANRPANRDRMVRTPATRHVGSTRP